MQLLCLLCLTEVPPQHTCSCGNAALLYDEHGHMNIYVDEITTTRQAEVYGTKVVLDEPFDTSLYADITPLNVPHSFTPMYKDPFAPKKVSPFDTKLIHDLTKFKHKTSDGNETIRRRI